MYCYVWSFAVRPEYVKEFQAAYGPGGDWARFFGSDPEYIRTHLLTDRENPARFLTIDFWSSYDACASFRERFTTEEVQIGSFDVLGERG